MNKFTNPLSNVKIASPCSQDWEAMSGNNRQRYCGECKLNVYNLSGMTRTEAENLLQNAEGRLCVRFYKRADGTVLTQDCPVGWAAFKRRVSKTAAGVASLLFGVIGGLGINSYFGKADKEIERREMTMGAIAYKPSPTPTPKATPDKEVLMGEIAFPEPTPKKKDLKKTIKKVMSSPENQS